MTQLSAKPSPFPTLTDSEWAQALTSCRPNENLPANQIPALEREACCLLTAVEEFLRPHEGKVLPYPWPGVIHDVKHGVLAALRLHFPAAYVNRVRRESGLLTVCYGTDERQAFQRHSLLGGGYRYVNGDGCGLVHPGSGKQFTQRYCCGCRQNKTRRRQKLELEIEARYLRGKTKIPARTFTFRGHTIPEPERWQGRCVRCGGWFTSSRADAIHCSGCG